MKGGFGVGYSHYVASKGAIISLTYSLPGECGEYGINAKAVCAVLIDSP